MLACVLLHCLVFTLVFVLTLVFVFCVFSSSLASRLGLLSWFVLAALVRRFIALCAGLVLSRPVLGLFMSEGVRVSVRVRNGKGKHKGKVMSKG